MSTKAGTENSCMDLPDLAESARLLIVKNSIVLFHKCFVKTYTTINIALTGINKNGRF